MKPEDHRHYGELLGAYILGQLEDPEANELERHLEECAGCKGEEAVLREAADLLTAALPDLTMSPPPGLKDRVLATAFYGRRARKRRDPACIRRRPGWRRRTG